VSARHFYIFVALGGLCALLGFAASITQNSAFFLVLVPAYLVLTIGLLGAGCKAKGNPASGNSYRPKEKA
jgi:hypothetical protein